MHLCNIYKVTCTYNVAVHLREIIDAGCQVFIYRCKYSKSKPNILEYFNELNMNRKSEYIIAERNKSLAEHYKKWRNICDFN